MSKFIHRTCIALIMLILIMPALGVIMSWAEGVAEWTILVYTASNNDLEPVAIKDLAEMEVYASTNKVNVIVLIDRSSDPYEERYNTEFANALGD